MLRVGTIGKTVATDLVDRVITIGGAISANPDAISREDRSKYRQFLLSELKKLDEQDGYNKKRNEKIDVE